VNRKRCGDAAELSFVGIVGYARVNSSIFSLALYKVPRVLAVLVFTVSWFQTVGASTEKARYETEVQAHMVDVEDWLYGAVDVTD